MKKGTVWTIVVLSILAAVLFYYMFIIEPTTLNLSLRAEEYCRGTNVSSVEVSQSEQVIRVSSSLLGGGSVYYAGDSETGLRCPVVEQGSMSEACKAILAVEDWETVCTNEAPAHEEAEVIAFNFVLDSLALAPPATDADALDRVLRALSEEAQGSVKRETASRDVALFLGIQDVPDQGVSVEDLQVVSPSEVYVVLSLQFGGSRVLRHVHLVIEHGTWKVDRVDAPKEVRSFEQVGNVTKNAPGMIEEVWYLVYEAPGQPALSKQLEFNTASTCILETEKSPCDEDELELGMRAKVFGAITTTDTVLVHRLEKR